MKASVVGIPPTTYAFTLQIVKCEKKTLLFRAIYNNSDHNVALIEIERIRAVP